MHGVHAGLLRERGKNDDAYRNAVRSVVGKQVRALAMKPSAEDRGYVYVWCTNISRYIGKAIWARKVYRGRTGPVWRFREHLCKTFSRAHKEFKVQTG